MENRNFEDVVRSIASSEDDVDKVLKAARLERHEANRMTGEQKLSLAIAALIALVLIVVFGGMIFSTAFRFM